MESPLILVIDDSPTIRKMVECHLSQAGYRVARADLFRGATVVVTPTEKTELAALKTTTGLWEALGARVTSLDPETHDRTVAAISHLPHLVADALVDCVGDLPGGDRLDYDFVEKVGASARIDGWRQICADMGLG